MPALTKIDESGAAVGDAQLDDRLVRGRSQYRSAARGRPRRAGRSPARHPQGQEPRRGQRRRREAVAPKGYGSCPGRLQPHPALDGGGVAFPPIPRDHSFKINKKARAKAFRAGPRQPGRERQRPRARRHRVRGAVDQPCRRHPGEQRPAAPYLVVGKLQTVFVEVDPKDLGSSSRRRGGRDPHHGGNRGRPQRANLLSASATCPRFGSRPSARSRSRTTSGRAASCTPRPASSG